MSRPFRAIIDGPDGTGKDTILKLVQERLIESIPSFEVVRTTEPIEGDEDSITARRLLVSPTTDSSNRFLSAFYLYQENMRAANNKVPLQLLYRGFAGFVVYNEINWMTNDGQFKLIPKVDAAILITAPFETLTSRLERRTEQNEDYQDKDLQYRANVHSRYEKVFKDLSEKQKIPSLVVYNEDGFLEDSVKGCVDFILQSFDAFHLNKYLKMTKY
jgi:thymidylate kinase